MDPWGSMPPQNVVVWCVDEKRPIQALDRTPSGLPLKPGRCGTYTHETTNATAPRRCLPPCRSSQAWSSA
jgi:hypothetical protein